MRVYIIVSTAWNMVESVWSSESLATQAIMWHARCAKVPGTYFQILEREVDVAVKEIKE